VEEEGPWRLQRRGEAGKTEVFNSPHKMMLK
jgi:hypothetical protein